MSAATRTATVVHSDSATETIPPPVSLPDVAEMCRQKRAIVSHLPVACGHCASPSVRIVERGTGEIVAYCDRSGACGRSQVLYYQAKLTVPVFEKRCLFQAPAPTPPAGGYNAQGMPLMADGSLDYQRLHGLHIARAVCVTCGQLQSQHPNAGTQDRFGWTIVDERRVALPSDWPTFNERSGTWS